MIKTNSKNELRKVRHQRIRKKLRGTADKPRMSVFISLKHIYVQLIDDDSGKTITSASSLDKDLRDIVKGKKMTEVAKIVGTSVAKKAIEKGITEIVFDRGGYRFHGRIKALAEEARSVGLKF